MLIVRFPPSLLFSSFCGPPHHMSGYDGIACAPWLPSLPSFFLIRGKRWPPSPTSLQKSSTGHTHPTHTPHTSPPPSPPVHDDSTFQIAAALYLAAIHIHPIHSSFSSVLQLQHSLLFPSTLIVLRKQNTSCRSSTDHELGSLLLLSPPIASPLNAQIALKRTNIALRLNGRGRGSELARLRRPIAERGRASSSSAAAPATPGLVRTRAAQ